MKYLAKNLKFLRLKKGLKQSDVPGFSGSQWGNYELGTSIPGLKDFITITTYFGINEHTIIHTDLSKEGEYSLKIDSGKKHIFSEDDSEFHSEVLVKKYPKNEQPSVVNEYIAEYQTKGPVKQKDMLQLLELLSNLSMKIAEYIDMNKKVTDLESRLTFIEDLLKKIKK